MLSKDAVAETPLAHVDPYRSEKLKRVFDVTGALAGLLCFWPFLLMLSLAVRATSRGPAWFSQERVGRHGRIFTLYKLRTMVHGTPLRPTHEVTRQAITPLGSFLRRTKLDELPQLVNVLLGDMSLVGPRPCLTIQRELWRRRAASGVLALRPGITGLAQLRGVDMSDVVRLAAIDAEYVRRGTLQGDAALIARTIFRWMPK